MIPNNSITTIIVAIICLTIIFSAVTSNPEIISEKEKISSIEASKESGSKEKVHSTVSTTTTSYKVKSTTTTTSTTSTTTSTTTPTDKTSVEKTEEAKDVTHIKGILIANKTYALPSTYNPGVNSEAQSAFNKMQAAASNDGVKIWIRSGFRSYDYQKTLYNNYVSKDGKTAADTYSARPGHSEHQTGLAFDLNSLSTSFGETKEGKWLAKNCAKYGFIIRYPKGKESITGYQYEPWHVRYLGVETATKVYESGKCLEEYLGIQSKYTY